MRCLLQQDTALLHPVLHQIVPHGGGLGGVIDLLAVGVLLLDTGQLDEGTAGAGAVLTGDDRDVLVGVEVTGRGSLRSRGLGGGSLGGSGGALCRSRGSSGGIGRAAGSQAQSQRSSGNGSNCRSTFHVCILPFSQIYVV